MKEFIQPFLLSYLTIIWIIDPSEPFHISEDLLIQDMVDSAIFYQIINPDLPFQLYHFKHYAKQFITTYLTEHYHTQYTHQEEI